MPLVRGTTQSTTGRRSVYCPFGAEGGSGLFPRKTASVVAAEFERRRMSFTVSRGLADAGRWAAVATAVVEHLEATERATKRHVASPAPPIGAIEAARRFFSYVLEGIALDQKSTRGRRTPVQSAGSHPSPSMAGFSNLSIAVNVMRTAHGAASADLGKLEAEIRSLLQTLDRLSTGRQIPSKRDRNSLARFLSELRRQGEIERDAAVASQERPRTYPGLNF
jgi:hypothetical protein